MPSNPPPSQPRYVRRDDPLLFERYRLTPRQVRRAQSEGRLKAHKPSGPTGPAYVDLRQVRALFGGPLAGQGGDLDALIRRWAEDRDPAAQAALIAIVQKADAALWGDV